MRFYKLFLHLGLALCAAATQYEFKNAHMCAICTDVAAALEAHGVDTCAKFHACHVINAKTISSGCVSAGFCEPATPLRPSKGKGSSSIDLRIAKGFGTKDYSQIRVSVITQGPASFNTSEFDYSQAFRYKWTGNNIHSGMRTVIPGKTTTLDVAGQRIAVDIPAEGAGIAGVLIGDPCVKGGSITSLVGCTYADKFQTTTRTPALLNAFVSKDDIDFWGILGDNFYDRTGDTTKEVFDELSLDVKRKILVTVPGNHDYWILGTPAVGSTADQYANGHMQWYAMDAKAAEHVQGGSAGVAPFNFSVDPSKGHVLFGGNLPSLENSFFYNQIGNVGIVAYSGAYTLSEMRPYMVEACSWAAGKSATMKMVLLLGHWDDAGMGCEADMTGPSFYDEMATTPGCDIFDKKKMLKFFMGHTHCNVPHPHGKMDTGFMVAGQGMEGCGNYGIPILDTTENRVRVWHFPVVQKDGTDTYDDLMACIEKNQGWRGCTSMAENWLDQTF